jgi:Spy/CpxP family protein refolding chaperone
MKISKPMIIAALVAGNLLAWNLALRAGDTNTPPAKPAAGAPPAAKPAPGAPPADQRMQRGGGFDRLLEQLNLTDEQKPKAQAILEAQRQKGREIRQDASLSVEDKRAKAEALTESTDAQMKALLTPEQFEKWQKMPRPGRGPMRNRMMQMDQKAVGTNAPVAPPKK